jgi:hypothetical protein
MSLYSIGYQRLAVARLAEIVDALGAVLVDCRYRPYSQRPEFTGAALAARFGERYQQRGAELGGFGHTTAAGITRLRQDAASRNVLLMCMEEAPGDCHRHHAICWPAIPEAIHIYREELITAAALQAALDAGDDAEYEVCGDVADL